MDFLGDTDNIRISQCLATISKGLASPREDVGFLIGAGMSIAAGYPSGRALGENFLKMIFPPGSIELDPPTVDRLLSTYPLECIASVVERLPGAEREQLSARLKELYLAQPTNGKAQSGHEDFAALVGLNYVSEIFTTNFDLLIEHHIGTRAYTATQENFSRNLQEAKFPIYHVHGLLDDLDSYRITEQDLISGRHRHALNAFRASLYQSNVFVMIGYSMSDPDFRSVYLQNQHEFRDRSNAAHRPTYVVMPVADMAEYHLARSIWESRNAQLIPMTAADFFSKLRVSIKDSSIEQMRTDLKKYRHIGDSGLDALVTKAKKYMATTSDADALRFLLENVDI